MVVVKLVDEEIAELRGEDTDTGSGQNVRHPMAVVQAAPEGHEGGAGIARDAVYGVHFAILLVQ